MKLKNQCFLVLLCYGLILPAQKDSIHFLEPSKSWNSKRGKALITTEAIGAVGSLALLSYSWYRDYSTSNFHWFNDFDEWRGMDKIGHAVTSFYIADYVNQTLLWTGMNRKKAVIMSGITSYAYLSTIEILDGYSAGWGFSIPDAVMNSTGLLCFVLQNSFDPEKNIQAKFGFFPTEYRKYRPELLGANDFESPLKDYNGQTYWLSFNLQYFSGIEKVPSFINLAIGYGAGGLLGGSNNPAFNENLQALPNMERYSKILLSGDIQWTKIKTNNPYLKFILRALSFYKLPFPTLEYNTKNQFQFHWFK